MNEFGKLSKKHLSTCHEDLVWIMTEALRRSPVDFGISEGQRSLARQNQLYREGKSKIDGYRKKGKHNLTPSEAVDIYAYHRDLETRRKLVYDKTHLSFIVGIVFAVALELYEKGDTTHLVRWGGNWDKDGVIDYDQTFDDYPHIEIYKPK